MRYVPSHPPPPPAHLPLTPSSLRVLAYPPDKVEFETDLMDWKLEVEMLPVGDTQG